MKILLISGARPNFMKIAPIIRALSAKRMAHSERELIWKIVHTGQHYNYEMSQVFFDDLEIPMPDYFLEVGSGSHAVQTAKIMTAFEKVCIDEKPDIVIVVGDVNSTLACSIVAKKLLIKVAHVEAGLRSFDMTMPEEVNRVVTDSISDYLFVTEKSGYENLLREGKSPDGVFFVGHVMVDNLFYMLKKVKSEELVFPSSALKGSLGEYIFLTLHRPSNVDDPVVFTGIVDALNEISRELPIIFPVHPRTRKQIDLHGFRFSDSVFLLSPLPFMESLSLWKDARLVLTDSGGLQEETTVLGVPCFTIRENTERPITIEEGTNSLVGTTPERILAAYRDFRNGKVKKGSLPELWDGCAAGRIVSALSNLSKPILYSHASVRAL